MIADDLKMESAEVKSAAAYAENELTRLHHNIAQVRLCGCRQLTGKRVRTSMNQDSIWSISAVYYWGVRHKNDKLIGPASAVLVKWYASPDGRGLLETNVLHGRQYFCSLRIADLLVRSIFGEILITGRRPRYHRKR